MGNLRDQLKKAKLLSKQAAKRVAHEQRVHRSEVGRKGLEDEAANRQAEIEATQERTSEADREREADRATERKHGEEVRACRSILESEAIAPDRRGTVRWFFETVSGHLPSLSLEPSTLAKLQAGQLCVVKMGDLGLHDYGLLATEHARRVHLALPDRVAWAAPSAALELGPD